MSEKYYNYNDLEQMKEKAKKIDYEPDKKSFLRTMNPLEQKMALFFSRRPYDIINYLGDLNNKDTNMMLNELTNEEISKLLEQFTAEDKRNFYSNFSNSVLVNRFIANDKQAFNHVDELDLERKIELLDSSKVSTTKATETIYDSLSTNEKAEVESKITSIEGSIVIDNVIEPNENNLENNVEETEELDVVKENEQKIQLEEIKEEKEQLKEEKVEEKEKIEEKIQENKLKEINNFLKVKLEQYKQQNAKFNDINIDNPELFNSLSEELKEIVVNDFDLFIKEGENKSKQPEDILNEFQNSKEEYEKELINSVLNEKVNLQVEEVQEQHSYAKTL